MCAYTNDVYMRLSIITINRNNLEGLKKTVESVLCQTRTDFEYIIIDGASTDGSAEYLAEFPIKYHLWGFAYFIERVLFKLEKWYILK